LFPILDLRATFKHFLTTLYFELRAIDMPAKTNFDPEKIRQRKKAIGIVAVILLLTITVLAISLHISFIVWVLADLVVAGIANLLMRRVGSRPL